MTSSLLYALISVSVKDGIDQFARNLVELGFSIISSGGTYRYLKEHDIAVTSVEEFRQTSLIRRLTAANNAKPEQERIPEQNIHWASQIAGQHAEIHGVLLATTAMADQLEALGMVRISLVCVDYYALHAELERPDATIASIIEAIDVGGPTQATAASKGGRIVVSTPEDRQETINWLRAGRPNEEEFVTRSIAKALANNLAYYAPLVERLSGGDYSVLVLERAQKLGYAENRWMGGADLMRRFGSKDRAAKGALSTFRRKEGSEPGYINYTDADGGRRLIARIENFYRKNGLSIPAIAVGLKHGNPCGVGIADFDTGAGMLRAIRNMVAGNPGALFGGTVMTNFVIDDEAAALLRTYLTGKQKRPIDAVWAPTVTDCAVAQLRRVNNRCRMMVSSSFSYGTTELSVAKRFRQLEADEFLRQGPGDQVFNLNDPHLTKLGRLTKRQRMDMLLGLAICGAANSNTIVITKNGMMLGLGLCQNSRVVACEHAVNGARRCGHNIRGSVAVSDSFFPFNDGPRKLIRAGVGAIFATSGSLNDKAFRTLCRGRKRRVNVVMGPDEMFRMFCKH
ncbi:MAG: hypothetical protein A3J07_02830 [Candidatus Doudnabacteria bacterium RIFCSPLOWO2_02_FULL_49_13]|uniref:MGS-like domain-containing protein n=1 Tax=Candidatus Doudnabacteria bacterium RIFCSPHIGHO2_12_FULL_48_16 TaxID=1817838 RepID=A0A1F5PLS5_9BACT|nr:MAG: hypothetical protein A3B77_01470 [Candidatus Doudnabacteria bacterium RIFCSPHIGHO2_02_FULL_49_24]OGE89038.1 MAG: hypothetical protein A2760_03100 [Candidatus Doudnabacteria bacterium RIFCSPHIGHO2_01_FULL_50_67]OGE90612.1 MAG: hypothetical protein A3E29_02340 [Candidatus Doudnabacteria bacterium RIFCSPHIGHO2_12_FULL_48_16]OGE96769.1 MAG: hypothetical protein A2990_03610 [Candidatus Doudnabacteria bacterium RIFCSPLOWO2_01_FULL_49_40]OGF03005.1 MAG: hypothetical protein A3J07_02830 [Candid